MTMQHIQPNDTTTLPSEQNIYNTHDTTINYYMIIYIQHKNILVTITTELLTTVLSITNSYGAH